MCLDRADTGNKKLLTSLRGAHARGTLCVSTHSDDSICFAWQMLARGVLPEPVHHVVVFSESQHITRSLVPEVLPERAKATRLQEDRRFCAYWGMSCHHLGFPDRSLDHRAVSPTSALVRDIARRLRSACARLRCSFVLCSRPWGTHVHSHHLAVFHAASALVREIRSLVLLLADDQPYSRIPLHATVSCNERQHRPLSINMTELQMRQKTLAMRAFYKTQMVDSYLLAARQPALGADGKFSETLWLPSS